MVRGIESITDPNGIPLATYQVGNKELDCKKLKDLIGLLNPSVQLSSIMSEIKVPSETFS